MGIVFYTDFSGGNLYALSRSWSYTGGGTGVVIASGISGMGPYCLDVTPSNTIATLWLPSTYTELYVALRFRHPGDYSPVQCRFINSSGQILGQVNRDAGSDRVAACRGTTAIGYSANDTCETNTTYKMRIHYKPHDSAGIFKVYLGSTLEIDLSGIDTMDNSGNIAGLQFGYAGVLAGLYIGKLVVRDDELPALNWNIGRMLVDAAGVSSQMTSLLGGSNFNEVKETPPDLDDGVLENTNGEYDGYNLGALSGQVDVIRAVQALASVTKNGGSSLANIQVGLRTGDTNYFSASKAPDEWLREYREIWATNPNTSAAWQTSELAALQALLKGVT